MSLNEKQKRFTEEYIVDLNGKQAAIRAGYSEKTAENQASRLLRKDKVKEYLAELTKERASKVGLSAEYVLNAFINIAERCQQAVPVEEKIDGEWVETGEYRFDSTGANRALENIAKHLGMNNDSLTLKNPDGTSLLKDGIQVSFVKAPPQKKD